MQQQRRGRILNAIGAQIGNAYNATVGPTTINPLAHASFQSLRFYWQFTADPSSAIAQLFFKVDHRYYDKTNAVTLGFHPVSTKSDGGQIAAQQVISVARANAAGSFMLNIPWSLDDVRLSLHADQAGRGVDQVQVYLLGAE